MGEQAHVPRGTRAATRSPHGHEDETKERRMGAWSNEPFGNDGAGDLVATMSTGEFTFDALGWAFEDDYLEVDGGQYAIALVEIALVVQGARDPHPALADVDLTTVAPLFTEDRVRWIVEMADRALLDSESSELYELWDEAGELEEWRAPSVESLTRLRSTLG